MPTFYSGQLMVLTSHHPLLTVIKQPVIRMGIYCCAEIDGSDCRDIQQGATLQKIVKEKYVVLKNRLCECLSSSTIHKP